MDPQDPLADGWIVDEPLGVRRAVEGGLEVEAFSALGAMARLPVAGDGVVAVQVELELDRIELGSGLVVGVRDAAGAWLAAASLFGSGGRGNTMQFVGCLSLSTGEYTAGVEAPPRSARAALTARIRAAYDPATGDRRCEVQLGEAPPIAMIRTAPREGPPAELVVASNGEERWPATLITRGRIAALTVEGVRASGPGPRDTAWKLAARAPASAGAGSAEPASWAALAALERGDAGALRAALARMDPRDARLPMLLRAHPDDVAAALPRGSDTRALVRTAWGLAARYIDDPEIAHALLLPVSAGLVPDDDDARRILLARASLARAAGRRELAQLEASRLATGVDKRNRDAAEAWLLLARMALEDGDIEGAVRAARGFLGAEPSEAIGRERLAHTPALAPILDRLSDPDPQ
jgi:hypothetical protein